MKIAIKEAGRELRIIETHEKYRTNCVQEYTGKDERPDFVRLNDKGTLNMALNEAGLMLQLPANFLFSTSNPFFPIQQAVGTAVFVRHKYVNIYQEEIFDFEVEDITPEDIEQIKQMLDPTYQNELEQHFDKNKGSKPIYYTFF